MYLTPEEAKECARRRRLVAEYVPGVGARCVYCGEWGVPLYKGGWQKLAGGDRHKYFICPTCTNKFPAILKQDIENLRERSRKTDVEALTSPD